MSRIKITNVLLDLGRTYLLDGRALGFEIAQEHDVHAFYRLKSFQNHDISNQNFVIHIQGYPGLSLKEMYVSARLRNYELMVKERLKGVTVGNEHQSNIPGAFANLNRGVHIPYNAKTLDERISEECENISLISI